MVVLLLVGCGTSSPRVPGPPVPVVHEAPGEPVPFLDEPAWLEELLERRARIMMMHEGSITDPAWQALVLRPRYRAAFLASDTDTYDAIVALEYTEEQRAGDAAWATALQDAQTAFVATPSIAPAGYDLRSYVGYRVGPELPRQSDDKVVDYKAFLEFSDFRRSLTPARYAGFVARLDARGFRGDSKIDLRPGQVRFQYNNVIIHAPSIDMARCAEAVAIEYFGAELEHIARGIDAVVGRKTNDWHHFLLTGSYDELPAAVRDFVEYRAPVAHVSICGHG
jgi:hypothetical protein